MPKKKISQNVKHFECARAGCTTVVVQGQTGSLQPYHNHWTNLGPRLCSKCYKHYYALEPEKAKHNKRNKKKLCDKEVQTTDEEVLSDALEANEVEVTVQEHTIVGDGSELAESKELELVVDENSEGQSTIKHTMHADEHAELDAVYNCEESTQPTTSTPSLGKLVSFEPEENEDFEEDCKEKEAHHGTLNYGFYVRQKKCKK